MLKAFIRHYEPYKVLFCLDLVAAFLLATCDLVYPMITREIINEVVPNQNLSLLGIFAFALIIIFLVKAGLNYFMQYWGHVVGVRMQADMRKKVFGHLQRLPNRYFDEHKTGVIMSRMINDLMEISELAHHGPEDLFISGVMLIGSFGILAGINLPLTLIIFSLIPLILLFAILQRKRMNNAFKKTRVKTGDINATVENSIAGIRVTKSFCTQEQEKVKFEESNQSFVDAREGAYKVMGQYFSSMNFVIDALEVVALVAAGYFTYLGKINLGDFAAYILYIKILIQPIRKLINFAEQYENGITGFERYMELMKEEQEKETKNPQPLGTVEGNIIFDRVSFTYGNEPVLTDFSLMIPAGKTFALVGTSGGGKTTLCNLIPRFYECEQGAITIDGVNIQDVRLDELRKNIGIVQQDVFLFTGTIKENIVCGKSEASLEEVIWAAQKARIHDFICSLPDGYETYIGERGVKLSGGQKQRISIARVFLKNPPIMILDEATSALDNQTEQEIQSALEELSRGRTNIVVAHRLSTIKNADQIIVLTNEGIVEQGSHEELLANAGLYYQLHGK